jgi:hypothetical protein
MPDVTRAEPPPTQPAASEDYPALVRAVAAAERRHTHIGDPLDRTVALTTLIRALQEQLELVAGERDQALIEVLAAHTHPSHRRLSTDLFLSRQRVDQLAAIARRGGRARRD